jgi:AraC family transcriptional regulator
MSLLTLAAVAEMSVHHFKEAFKVKKGQPPHQYLNERRVIHAKEMLSGTDMPIVQIALAVGFSGQSHLTMNFRKLTKTTPLQYRLASRLGRVSRTDPT